MTDVITIPLEDNSNLDPLDEWLKESGIDANDNFVKGLVKARPVCNFDILFNTTEKTEPTELDLEDYYQYTDNTPIPPAYYPTGNTGVFTEEHHLSGNYVSSAYMKIWDGGSLIQHNIAVMGRVWAKPSNHVYGETDRRFDKYSCEAVCDLVSGILYVATTTGGVQTDSMYYLTRNIYTSTISGPYNIPLGLPDWTHGFVISDDKTDPFISMAPLNGFIDTCRIYSSGIPTLAVGSGLFTLGGYIVCSVRGNTRWIENRFNSLVHTNVIAELGTTDFKSTGVLRAKAGDIGEEALGTIERQVSYDHRILKLTGDPTSGFTVDFEYFTYVLGKTTTNQGIAWANGSMLKYKNSYQDETAADGVAPTRQAASTTTGVLLFSLTLADSQVVKVPRQAGGYTLIHKDSFSSYAGIYIGAGGVDTLLLEDSDVCFGSWPSRPSVNSLGLPQEHVDITNALGHSAYYGGAIVGIGGPDTSVNCTSCSATTGAMTYGTFEVINKNVDLGIYPLQGFALLSACNANMAGGVTCFLINSNIVVARATIANFISLGGDITTIT